MGLTEDISDFDLGYKGIISGDVVPSDNKGLLSKLRSADEQNQTAVRASWMAFKAHDHSAIGAKLGSVKPDASGLRADSFSGAAFTNPKLGALSVNSAAIGQGAIQTAHILDGDIPKEKLGDAKITGEFSISSGGTFDWVHELGRIAHYEAFGVSDGVSWLEEQLSNNTKVAFGVISGCPVNNIKFRIVYR